jgi:hypothetical protein
MSSLRSFISDRRAANRLVVLTVTISSWRRCVTTNLGTAVVWKVRLIGKRGVDAIGTGTARGARGQQTSRVRKGEMKAVKQGCANLYRIEGIGGLKEEARRQNELPVRPGRVGVGTGAGKVSRWSLRPGGVDANSCSRMTGQGRLLFGRTPPPRTRAHSAEGPLS